MAKKKKEKKGGKRMKKKELVELIISYFRIRPFFWRWKRASYVVNGL